MNALTTVAVDFDGVIHNMTDGYLDGSIYGDLHTGATDALLRLMRRHAVFIHTARKPKGVARWIERQTGYTIECTTMIDPLPWRRKFWNKKNLLLVTNRKLPAVAYIDDRGIRFEDWEQTFTDLQKYEGIVA